MKEKMTQRRIETRINAIEWGLLTALVTVGMIGSLGFLS